MRGFAGFVFVIVQIALDLVSYYSLINCGWWFSSSVVRFMYIQYSLLASGAACGLPFEFSVVVHRDGVLFNSCSVSKHRRQSRMHV